MEGGGGGGAGGGVEGGGGGGAGGGVDCWGEGVGIRDFLDGGRWEGIYGIGRVVVR